MIFDVPFHRNSRSLSMTFSIAALLAQDGVTNGAIYALLALALVLVFTVTRVIFIPSGEFVTYGTLTLAGLQLGKPPGTVGLLVGLPLIAGAMERCATARQRALAALPRRLALYLILPLAIAGLVCLRRRPLALPFPIQIVLTLIIVTALGPAALSGRLPAAGRGIGAGLAHRLRRCCISRCWGWDCGSSAPRARARRRSPMRTFHVGDVTVSGQSAARAPFVADPDRRALSVLRANAVRQGACAPPRSIASALDWSGISPSLAGSLTFTLAALLGAFSGAHRTDHDHLLRLRVSHQPEGVRRRDHRRPVELSARGRRIACWWGSSNRFPRSGPARSRK